MEVKKYKLTNEYITVDGHKLYRIQAIVDFSNVKCGEIGGFVESENNLSHKGNCWVYEDAQVFGDAKVSDNAIVWCDAKVFHNAQVFGYAKVYGRAKVYDKAMVYGDSQVCEDARVYGNAKVFNDAKVYCSAKVFDNAQVYGYARVREYVLVNGYAEIRGNADVSNLSDYFVFKNNWSSGRYFTWTKSNNMWSVGCFYGTGSELIKKAYRDGVVSGKKYEKFVKFVESLKQL